MICFLIKSNRIKFYLKKYLIVIASCICLYACTSKISYTNIGEGWSNNSINTVKFRKNALTTFNNTQFVAYYNVEGYLVLGKRDLNSSKWLTLKTKYKGNVKDAHNSISIVVDGDGFLHVSWDHHNTKLRYAISKTPHSLELGEEIEMTGLHEERVTYPEFYNMPNGDLIFFYRSGESGRGNLVINSYNVKSKKWSQLQSNLIDGENKRSAYWQACVDAKGFIHVSWVWRETWGVETNHDLCYARSDDGGVTWKKSSGEKYSLPITLATAEYALKIPQKSNLINQTSMTTDGLGNPFVVNYWNDDNEIPQFQVVYLNNKNWKKVNTGFREVKFILGGGGTKRIPISRPSVIVEDINSDKQVSILFRDEERKNRVSVAQTFLNDISWKITDLTEYSVGQWEPNYDVALWKRKKELHVFLQDVTQIDGEGVATNNSSMVKSLKVQNLRKVTRK